MKIAYLCGADIAKKRGYSVHTLEVARQLKKLGAEILVLASAKGALIVGDLKIINVPVVDIAVLRPVVFRTYMSVVLFWLVVSGKADIIYIREIHLYLMPFILGKIFKKPVVIEINDAALAMDNISGRPKKIFQLAKFYVRKLSFLLGEKIIVANQEVKELLVKEYDIDEDKFAVIPMGANTDLFRPMDMYKCREKLNLDRDSSYVAFVGTLYPFQGLKYLVEAAVFVLKKKKNIKFLIVGSGPDEANIKNLVKKRNLDDNFIFTGEKEYDTIPFYINSSDLCISFVTRQRSETFSFPIKIYEYLSCARPVVIGNLKNKSELLQRNVTPVVDITDPDALSDTIIDMLERSSNLKEASGQLRRIVADNYSWGKTAEMTLELFNSEFKP